MSYPFNLGEHSWPISSSLEAAQTWFDRGVMWLYGFNHREAVTCFRQAQAADPDCAVAWWGEAYASGPFYNLPWDFLNEAQTLDRVTVCAAATAEAMARRGCASPLERRLVEALSVRYQADEVVPQSEFSRWNDEFADAMREIHRDYPEHPDVAALFAEALITRTPWHLWNVERGEPEEGACTLEAIEVLEDAMNRRTAEGAPPHPGMLHFYLHATEMSPTPERALAAADALHFLSPDNGHLNHMPTHIYLQCGRYADAIEVSRKAVAADDRYSTRLDPFDFYTTSRCHDLHAWMHAAMFLGHHGAAREAADRIAAIVTPELLGVDQPHFVSTLDGYRSMCLHVDVRFGQWEDIVTEPDVPAPDRFVVTSLMQWYARAVAHAALREPAAADEARSRFEGGYAQLPDSRFFFNNRARDILAVAREMLLGEVAYHAGDHEIGFGHLRGAARLCDDLHYSEPWPWMHPPRHALGALLLEQGRVEEAEDVYRADLGLDGALPRCLQHPDNVWSLRGLEECLVRTGRTREASALAPALERASARCDFEIRSSCCCRGSVAPAPSPFGRG